MIEPNNPNTRARRVLGTWHAATERAVRTCSVRRMRLRRAAAIVVATLVVIATFAAAPPASVAEGEDPPVAKPIQNWFGQTHVERYIGTPHTPNPAVGQKPPQHPYMAGNGSNTMHGDSYTSGAHAEAGPLGVNPKVTTASFRPIGGQCATVAFDSQGRIVTVCAGFDGFDLRLLDPVTLGEYTSMSLPQRPSTIEALLTFDLQKIFTDTSGGAYFYLDNQDRAVLVDAFQQLRVIGVVGDTGSPRFEQVAGYNLLPYLERDCWKFPTNMNPSGNCDVVSAVMPDWDGNYWWVSRFGVVGVVDRLTGGVQTLQLEGEEIQNSFATAADGVYIVSDHAMYRFEAGPSGAPQYTWREEYERGTGTKPGQINQGSGSSPTLIGDDIVAITDNDDPINVLFLKRDPAYAGDRVLCEQQVFEAGRGVTDNSLVGYGNSVVVENNYGYQNFLTLLFGNTVTGGLTKVDLVQTPSGAHECEIAWTSVERSPSTVPKLSVASGLVYVYTKPAQQFWIDAWYFTAIDWHTGETAYKVLTGTGWNFDNNWSPMTVGPGGVGYAGTFNGLVNVIDTPG